MTLKFCHRVPVTKDYFLNFRLTLLSAYMFHRNKPPFFGPDIFGHVLGQGAMNMLKFRQGREEEQLVYNNVMHYVDIIGLHAHLAL